MTEKASQPIPSSSRLRQAVVVLLLIGLAVGCFWRFSDWHQRFGFETLVEWGKFLQGHPWTPVGIILAFIVAGLLFFLHAALLWAVVFAFDMKHALIYCEMGSLASAFVLYGLGRVLRRDVVRKLTGSYAGEVSHALGRKGVLSLFLLHVFPICPYSVLNLLAGATHINTRDFTIGTLLGITPGIVVLCVFGHQFAHLIQNPTWEGFLGLAVFIAIGFWVLSYLRKGFQKNAKDLASKS